ncbi:MAG: hypothetical protein ABI400_03925 [Lacisediminihabitans sp.]
MKRSAVPGALRRVSRDRSRLVAVLLLALVALSAAGIQSAAAATLQRTLDANWRGAYDILVTAKGANVGTGGLLAPNSLGDGAYGMTLAQVAKVRQIAGIEVAAPIGEVMVPQQLGSPSVSLPESAVSASKVPQAFRVKATYTTNDGLLERYVHSESVVIVIDNLPDEDAPVVPANCNLNGFEVDPAKYPHLCQSFSRSEYSPVTVSNSNLSGFSQGADLTDGVLHFSASSQPQPSGATRITLVDPAAERKLLGKDGAFLAPLQNIRPTTKTGRADMDAWARSAKNAFTADYLAQQARRGAVEPPTAEQKQAMAELDAFNKEHGVDQQVMKDTQTYVPLLASRAPAATLDYTINVTSVGDAPRKPLDANSTTYFPYSVPTNSTGTNLGESTIDASGMLNPFDRTPIEVAWPGTPKLAPGTDGARVSLRLGAAGVVSASKVTVRKGANGTVSATLDPSGYAQPIVPQRQNVENPFALLDSGTKPGSEAAYATVTKIPTMPNDGGRVAVPVGSFSLDQLADLQSSLSYVPLGAYQPVGSSTAKGETLRPSVSGVGLVSAQTVAIASINSAPAWGQASPVSAIRVRVAGISSYSLQSQQKVIAVAQAIQKLGLTATIVAGSSPSEVKVAVDGYAFGVTDASKLQRVGSLGTVTQQWSEFGAAARADVAVSTASLSVLGIALGSTSLLLGAVQFASIARRRSQAAVMREIGWTRARIRRWMFAEEIPAVLIVLAAGIAAVALSGLQQISVVIAALGVAVVVVTSIVAVILGAQGKARVFRVRESGGRRMLLLRGRSILTFGLRQARIHLITSITLVVAILIVALASAGLAEVFFEGRRRAGASLLAQFVTGQAALFQLVLGAVALASGIILAVLARRIDLARRSPQWAALRAMGWTASELRSAQRTEAATVAIPAILVAAAASFGGAHLLGSSATIPLLVTGVGAAVAASLVLLFVRRKALAQ